MSDLTSKLSKEEAGQQLLQALDAYIRAAASEQRRQDLLKSIENSQKHRAETRAKIEALLEEQKAAGIKPLYNPYEDDELF